MKCNYRSPYWNELYHYGVKGQKWGIRRYQNSDGTLTELGRQRYGNEANFDEERRAQRRQFTKAALVTIGSTAIGAGIAALPVVSIPVAVASGAAVSFIAKKAFNISAKDLFPEYMSKGEKFAVGLLLGASAVAGGTAVGAASGASWASSILENVIASPTAATQLIASKVGQRALEYGTQTATELLDGSVGAGLVDNLMDKES